MIEHSRKYVRKCWEQTVVEKPSIYDICCGDMLSWRSACQTFILRRSFFIFWYCGVSFVGWTKCIQLAWYVHIKPTYRNYVHELPYRPGTQPFWDKIVPEIVSGFISILLRQVTRKNWCLMTWCSQTIRGVLWLNGLIFKNAGNPCVLIRVPIDFPETNQLQDTLCVVPGVAQRVAEAEARWKT